MRQQRMTWALAATFALTGGAFLRAADADKPVPDLVKNAIDPFNPGTERTLFLKAAGVDGELDQKEFKADAEAGKGFVRVFEKWPAIKQFDKNKNDTIDWYEAKNYRLDLRKRVLAEYDKDKDNRLTGAEREAANKALAAGKLPKATAVTPSPGTAPDRPQRPGRRGPFGQRGRQFTERFDADGDGKLSPEERLHGGAVTIREGRQKMIDKYDTNGDGVLDASERQAAMNDRGDRWWLKIDDIGMKHFDENGDGKLSEEESMAIAEFGEKLRTLGKQWEVRFLDTDNDGKVSDEERQAMRRRMGVIGFTMMAKAVKWVDTDGDGVPSQEEMEAARKRAMAHVDDEVARWTKKFDANNDGRLNATERDALLKGINEDLLTRFKRNDKDGDGKLSNAEIISFVEEYAEEFGIKPKN